MIKKIPQKNTNGFALLYAVIIVSLILSITAGISNIVFKQSMLAGLAFDSQVAFYQADSAVECGMYQLLNADAGYDPSLPINCGDTIYVLDPADSDTTKWTFATYIANDTLASTPCASIIIDKTDPTKTVIQGHGFNICNTANPRHIERVLQVTY